jgi:hypothetical protein
MNPLGRNFAFEASHAIVQHGVSVGEHETPERQLSPMGFDRRGEFASESELDLTNGK